MSLIFPKSSFHLDSTQIPSFQPRIRSRIRSITGVRERGGCSGKRRTSSLRNSFVEIWRWKGYPQDWTRVSNIASARRATCGFRWLARRATSVAASRGLALKQVKNHLYACSVVEYALVGLLCVNVFCYFKMQCIIWFVQWWLACSGYEDLERWDFIPGCSCWTG